MNKLTFLFLFLTFILIGQSSTLNLAKKKSNGNSNLPIDLNVPQIIQHLPNYLFNSPRKTNIIIDINSIEEPTSTIKADNLYNAYEVISLETIKPFNLNNINNKNMFLSTLKSNMEIIKPKDDQEEILTVPYTLYEDELSFGDDKKNETRSSSINFTFKPNDEVEEDDEIIAMPFTRDVGRTIFDELDEKIDKNIKIEEGVFDPLAFDQSGDLIDTSETVDSTSSSYKNSKNYLKNKKHNLMALDDLEFGDDKPDVPELKVQYSDLHPIYIKPPENFRPVLYQNRKMDGILSEKNDQNYVTIQPILTSKNQKRPYVYPNGLSSWMLGGHRSMQRGGYWEKLGSDESLHGYKNENQQATENKIKNTNEYISLNRFKNENELNDNSIDKSNSEGLLTNENEHSDNIYYSESSSSRISPNYINLFANDYVSSSGDINEIGESSTVNQNKFQLIRSNTQNQIDLETESNNNSVNKPKNQNNQFEVGKNTDSNFNLNQNVLIKKKRFEKSIKKLKPVLNILRLNGLHQLRKSKGLKSQ